MKCYQYLIFILLIVNFFCIPSIGKEFNEEIIDLKFSNPEIILYEDYILINVNETNGHLFLTDKPILPFYSINYTFPFKTKNFDIKYDIKKVEYKILSKKILPATRPIIPGIDEDISYYSMDPIIYNSDELFPDSWYKINTGGGLNSDNELKTFLNIRVFPVRYSPKTNTLQYIEEIEITLSYKIPTNNFFSEKSEFDMVIISPSKFSDELNPLINHKNNFEVNTFLKTTEEIFAEYDGFDSPEKIKYFIKDAIENWNIKYVLLIGGLNSFISATPRDDTNQGFNDWYLPVRYSNLRESGNNYDPGFICDLYFADIFDSDGNFSSWDSNNDGIYAKWNGLSILDRDDIDFYPDVYVGRLPCRNSYEVSIMVKKIINYESTIVDSSWYNKIVIVGGDPYNDSIVGTNYYEGELIGDKIASFMTDFEKVKLYSSNRDTNMDFTPLTINIVREISNGCGHLFLDGHGHPGYWNTGWPDSGEPIENGGINVFDIFSLSNGDMLPVCVLGGCHTAQFNVTLFSTFFNKPFTWTKGFPVAECLNWHITRKINGGAIASIGNTGLGYEAEGNFSDRDGDGLNEPDCVEAWGGYLERCFYKSFYDGNTILGDIWGGAIRKYQDTYPGMIEQWDAKVMQCWVLLGDPSLKIGGNMKI